MNEATQKLLSEIDWATQRDVDVAKKLGVTRENARILRQNHGHPCINKRKSSKRVAIEEFLKTATIPATAGEMYRALPVVITKLSAFKLFRKLGLKLDYTAHREGHSSSLNQVDWRLPNAVLDAIWAEGKVGWEDGTSNWAANSRSRVSAGPAKWHIGGAQGFTLTKSGLKPFLAACATQVKRAKSLGVLKSTALINPLTKKISENVLT